MSVRIASIVSIVLIMLIPFWPLAKAEETITVNERIPISLTTPKGIDGNYTVDWSNLSSVPLASDGFTEALSSFGLEEGGIYIGAYEGESLFEWDYTPPAPETPYAGQIEAGHMPTIYAQYRALEAGLDYARMYASISTMVSIDASSISEGVSGCIVRVPVPYSGIVPSPPISGGAPAFLQITRIEDGRSYITISGAPNIVDGLPYENTVTINDRQYMHVTAPLLSDTLYEFKYFWCLQGEEYDGTGEMDVTKPLIYYTAEDILAAGMESTLELGFAYYNTTTGVFEISNATSYGGASSTLPLDAGWSIMAVEGMGEGRWGQRVDTSNDREFIFHPTVEISANRSLVSLYIPFVCDQPIRLKQLTIRDNNPGAAWETAAGVPCAGDFEYYWNATDDCDADGYADHPDLNFTDYILITTRTYIQPCSTGNESAWTVKLVFYDDYNITFLCSEGQEELRGGGTPHTGGSLPAGISPQWDTTSGDTWFTYNSKPHVYLHLTGNESYTYYNSSADGNDAYAYPRFYRYQVVYVYGTKKVYVEVNETVYLDAVARNLWEAGPDERNPTGSLLDELTNSIMGFKGLIGSLSGYIWDAITWVGSQMEEIGKWLWNGILSIYDSIVIAVEAVINVLSYVIEFGIIAVTLLVFFGAIVLWNKILLVLRNALKKAEKSLQQGIA